MLIGIGLRPKAAFCKPAHIKAELELVTNCTLELDKKFCIFTIPGRITPANAYAFAL